jgi:hypothetical protein
MSPQAPLNVVLAPDYQADAITPGYEPRPDLNLEDLGGKTLPSLGWVSVYLDGWAEPDRQALDGALAAAMTDPGLNEVIAQYFPGETVEAHFAGSRTIPDAPKRADEKAVEKLVRRLHREGVLDGQDPETTAVVMLLGPGAVLAHGNVDSHHGLGGYHGSIHVGDVTVYYAVSVYSEGRNGIVAFKEPWQNVCATLYHELQEFRTDPDVEDAIRGGGDKVLGWYSPEGGEIGDIAIVMRQVPLADGSGTVPVQLMWSNRVSGPEAPDQASVS